MSDESLVPEILAEPSLVPPQAGESRLAHFLSQPDALRVIYRHVANGGCVLELAKMWGVKYCDIMEWIRLDPARSKLFSQAVDDRAEWAKESVLHELRQVAKADLRDVFDERGALKEPKDWPDSIAGCIAGVDVREEFDEDGKLIGYTKKIKLWDKIKANELRGKHLAMFIERHKHEVTNLEDLILASHKREEEE